MTNTLVRIAFVIAISFAFSCDPQNSVDESDAAPDCPDINNWTTAAAFCSDVDHEISIQIQNLSACTTRTDCVGYQVKLECENFRVSCCGKIINPQHAQEIDAIIYSFREKYCGKRCRVGSSTSCDSGRAECVDAGHCI